MHYEQMRQVLAQQSHAKESYAHALRLQAQLMRKAAQPYAQPYAEAPSAAPFPHSQAPMKKAAEPPKPNAKAPGLWTEDSNISNISTVSTAPTLSGEAPDLEDGAEEQERAAGEPAAAGEERPAGLRVERLGGDGRLKVHWPVDARKLRGRDKQIISPSFEIQQGLTFRLMVKPTFMGEKKGQASFSKARGRGSVELKFVEGAAAAPVVRFRVKVGQGEPRGPVVGDFGRRTFCGLPKDIEEFDFQSAVDPETSTFLVSLEVLPTPAAGSRGGVPSDSGEPMKVEPMKVDLKPPGAPPPGLWSEASMISTVSAASTLTAEAGVDGEEGSAPGEAAAAAAGASAMEERPLERESSVARALRVEPSDAEGHLKVQWPVDARILRRRDRQVISPSFDIFGAAFKLMVKPKQMGERRCEASFGKARGRGTVELKVVEGAAAAPAIRFQIAVGQEAPRGPVEGDFSQGSVCGLPTNIEEFDFLSAVDSETSTFLVSLEVLPAAAADA